MIDIKAVKEAARKEVAEEEGKKAKEALKSKLKALAAAEQIVRNIKREVDDLEQSIADGTFTG
jgi:hypothetical protein